MRGRRIRLAATTVAVSAAAGLVGVQLEEGRAQEPDVADVELLAVDPVVDRGPLASLASGQPSRSGGRVVAVGVFTRRAATLSGVVRVGLYRAAPGAATGRRVTTNGVRFARGGTRRVYRVPVSVPCAPARRGSVWFTVSTAGYRVGPLGALVVLKAKSRGSLLRCNRG
jgi:hypothetical protein